MGVTSSVNSSSAAPANDVASSSTEEERTGRFLKHLKDSFGSNGIPLQEMKTLLENGIELTNEEVIFRVVDTRNLKLLEAFLLQALRKGTEVFSGIALFMIQYVTLTYWTESDYLYELMDCLIDQGFNLQRDCSSIIKQNPKLFSQVVSQVESKEHSVFLHIVGMLTVFIAACDEDTEEDLKKLVFEKISEIISQLVKKGRIDWNSEDIQKYFALTPEKFLKDYYPAHDVPPTFSKALPSALENVKRILKSCQKAQQAAANPQPTNSTVSNSVAENPQSLLSYLIYDVALSIIGLISMAVASLGVAYYRYLTFGFFMEPGVLLFGALAAVCAWVAGIRLGIAPRLM